MTATMVATTSKSYATSSRTIADLVESLGNIPLDRIRMEPLPGTATENDVVHLNDVVKETRCELIGKTIVEKAQMSYLENRLAFLLAGYLHIYLKANPVGIGLTEGAMYRLTGGNIRLPDISVALKERFPSGIVERVPYVDFAPDFAVEILSRSNTAAEISRKRRELFASGMKLMWVVDPEKRTVEIFTAPEAKTILTENDTLTGGDLLPGFSLSIKDWFREAEEV